MISLKFYRNLVVIVFAGVLISGCSTAPKKPDRIVPGNYDYVKAYISWLVRKEMKDNQVVGASIAVVDDQRILWAQGFGYADNKKMVPSTPETVYPIGSISKLFTVMGTMQLVEQKKVDIDQPLKTYLSGFSIKSRFPESVPITPRSMMTHHSGLPNDMPKGALTSEPPATLLERIQDEYVAYPPNYVLAYSNVAMALLGLMTEQVSNTEFCEYMQQSVFDPIGMHHSSFKITPEIKGFLSKGYRNGAEAKQIQLRDVATGSMVSNVLDLSRFIKMVFEKGTIENRKILQPDTIDEMLRPQNEAVTLDFDQRVGLGWFLTYVGKNEEKIASHAGNMPLFHTTLAILPEKKIGLVILTNSAEGRRIYDKIAAAALKLLIEAKTGKALEKREPEIIPPDNIASEEMLRSYVGRYAAINMLGSVERDNNTLKANVGGYRVRLIPSSNGKFGVEKKWLGVFPQKKIGALELEKVRLERIDVACRKFLVIRYDGRHWFTAEKIDPLPLPDTWENALGPYQVANPDPESSIQDVTLSSEDDLLVFTYTFPVWGAGKRTLYFVPISETEAITLGVGRNSGETMQIVNIDNRKEVRFFGFRMKKNSGP